MAEGTSEELSLEQQQAIAVAKARADMEEAKAPPSWGEVLSKAPIKAVAGLADEVINTPENLYKLGQVGYGTAATALGHPEMAPDVQPTPHRLTGFLESNHFLPNMENATPGQRVADAAVQGATLGLASPASTLKQLAVNATVSALSSGSGEVVTQVTGNPWAGFATSVATGVGASAVPSANAARKAMEDLNALRDETLKKARDRGFVVVPEGQITEFANRPKLTQMAENVNQTITNDVAREAVGLPKGVPVTPKALNAIRDNAYNQGYVPLKRMGPVTADYDYMKDLNGIESKYIGAGKSFPNDFPKKLRDLVDNYRVPTMDAGDVVDKVRQLRNEANLNINSDKPIRQQMGWAQKEIANAMENVLERQARFNGLPDTLVDNYKAARRRIAVTHTVEDAMERGSGNVDINKLARGFQKGDYMEGDLETAAAFGNINRPPIKEAKDSNMYWYTHATGLTLGGMAAHQLGLTWEYSAPFALAGDVVAKNIHDKLARPVRNYVLSPTGQKRAAPNYEGYGLSPKTAAAGAFGLYNSEQMYPEEEQ